MTNRSKPDHPPIAARKKHSFTHHGIRVEDHYAWLRDPGYPEIKSPAILAYLNAENDWFDTQMAPLTGLTDKLFEELKGRQAQDDACVPYQQDGWMYQWRFAHGAQYRTWWRWPVDTPQAEVCFLDEPALADDAEFFRLGGMSISTSGQFLAYCVDTSGGERYSIRIRDLFSDTQLDDQIDNTGGSVTWAADNNTLFYTLLSEPVSYTHLTLPTIYSV